VSRRCATYIHYHPNPKWQRKLGGFIRFAYSSDQIFIFTPLDETEVRSVMTLRRSFEYVIYVLAITTTTLGWLGFIVWCAMKLV
jgi:hypothetical protein